MRNPKIWGVHPKAKNTYSLVVFRIFTFKFFFPLLGIHLKSSLAILATTLNEGNAQIDSVDLGFTT
jgi:hypothetical protein